MIQKLFYGLSAMLLLCCSEVQAADTASRGGCGMTLQYLESMAVSAPGAGATAGLTAPGAFPTSAIETCGKFVVYYEDRRPSAPAGGFNEGGGIGATRRNTLCTVLTYIQSVFEMSTISGYIKLHVDTSYSAAHKMPVRLGMDIWYDTHGMCAPYYRTATAGALVNGFVHDYIKSGSDPNPGDYHANLKMNFEAYRRVINDLGRGISPDDVGAVEYTDGGPAPDPCKYDLNSILLHMVSHSLGWFSWQDTGSLHGVSVTRLPYSSYDDALQVIPNPATTLNPFSSMTKMLTAGTLRDSSMVLLNNKRPPHNRFVYYGGPYKYAPFPVIYNHSHLTMNYYHNAQRITPGDLYAPVMGQPFMEGTSIREYTKAEVLHFRDVIGLNLKSSYTAAHGTLLNNRLPWSSRMNSDAYNFLAGHKLFAERVAADFTITNNTGTTLSIDLNSDPNIWDDDGDLVSVYPGSLVNFRGCGNGGNNHNQLALSSADEVITYTPRPGFYGRAQFGFNLFDGHEKGAFVLYTIEVKPGTNVSAAPGTNMVVNGNFEEGSEVKIRGGNEGINNSSRDGFLLPEETDNYGRFTRGALLSDGHPYDVEANFIYGTAVRNSYAECGTATSGKPFGHPGNSFPWLPSWVSGSGTTIMGVLFGPKFSDGLPDALAGSGTNNRYQPLSEKGLLLNLTDTLKKCKRYVLEFDAVRTFNGGTSFSEPESYPLLDELRLGFTNTALITSLDTVTMIRSSGPYPLPELTRAGWRHFKVAFTYCGDTPSHVLHLGILGAKASRELASNTLIDNVSLLESPLALSIKIIDSTPKACTRTIYAGPPATGCPALSYTWRNKAGAVVGTARALSINAWDTTRYTVTVSDGCSSASDTINIAFCDCSPVKVFGSGSISRLSGPSVSGSYGSGFYHLVSDVAVTANTTFSGANILVEPGVKITVNANNKLTISNAHLFTCPDTNRLWKGIVLSSAGAASGKVLVNGNALIEDAEVAIDAPGLIASATNIIETDQAVFNRNLLGVRIENYNSSTAAVYPFSFTRTVFTSRQFKQSGSTYPLSWPAHSLLISSVNNGIYAPYYLSREYTKVFAKNTERAEAGIKLNAVGLSSGGTYSELIIGGGLDTSYANMFDHMGAGVIANRSNLTCINNTFMNMYNVATPHTPGGYTGTLYHGMGIFANNITSSRYRLRSLDYLPGFVNGGINKFFDCITAIRTAGYYENEMHRNRITSSQVLPTGASSGIYVWPLLPYKSVRITGNDLSNLVSGISLVCQENTSSTTTEIADNQLLAANPRLPSGTSAANQFMNMAIWVSSYRIIAPSLSYLPGPEVAIRGNHIDGAYNGIIVSNMHHLNVKITGHLTLKLREMAGGNPQYGIQLQNCHNATISGNTLSADAGSAMPNSDKVRGMHLSFNTNLTVCNNSVSNFGRSFDFALTTAQHGTRWVLNGMNNGLRGFVLGSDIGDQALNYSTYLVTPPYFGPTGNHWDGTWSPSRQHTFTENARRAMNSKLYVRSSPATENPTFHVGGGGTIPYSSASILPSPYQLASNCEGYIYPPVAKKPLDHPGKVLGLRILSDDLDSGPDFKANRWMAQFGLYRAGKTDPALYDDDGVFSTFMAVAAGSRFGWLMNIEDALGQGNLSLAQSLLSSQGQAMDSVVIDTNITIADFIAANHVANNYRDFYTIYLHQLQQDSLDAADSTGLSLLARKCPSTDGAIVFDARTMFNAVYGHNIMYDDDNCSSGTSILYRFVKEQPDNKTDLYSLYPNPNNGSFVIKQNRQSNNAVNLKVYNALGSLVHRQTDAAFVNGQLAVQLQQNISGVYLVCISDGQERDVCLRFIVK